MFPVLFKIGPFTLYSVWLFVAIGFLVGTMLFLKAAKYERLDLLFLLDHTVSLALGTMLFSRLFFFFTSWGYLGPLHLSIVLKQIFFFWQPGYSFWGAVLGFMLMLAFHCYRNKQDLMEWIEAGFTPFLIGMIFGHIGQFLDGQGYGNETILPWGITFTSTTVKYTVPIHPTQLYAILIIAMILLSRKKFTQKFPRLEDNETWTLMALATYSLLRFGLEFLRGDDTLQLGVIRIGHLVTLILFVSFSILLYKKWRPKSS